MSLTKKTLLAELACSKPERLGEKMFGYDIYVKPVSEFQRSRRLASMVGKDGEVDKNAIRKARVYTLIDHLCDKDGTGLFKDSDVNDLLELDALKLDVLNHAIEQWVTSREGKFVGGSKG